MLFVLSKLPVGSSASTMAGLMTIGNIANFGIEALQKGGLSEGAAKAVAGTAMGVFYALANGLGRIAWSNPLYVGDMLHSPDAGR